MGRAGRFQTVLTKDYNDGILTNRINTGNDIKNRWYSTTRTNKKKLAKFKKLHSKRADYPGCFCSDSLTVQDLRECGRCHTISDFCLEKQNDSVKYVQSRNTIRI